MSEEIDEELLQEFWEKGFDTAVDYYDGFIDEMHRALHPDAAFSYKKCFEVPCKDIW